MNNIFKPTEQSSASKKANHTSSKSKNTGKSNRPKKTNKGGRSFKQICYIQFRCSIERSYSEITSMVFRRRLGSSEWPGELAMPRV